MSVHLEDAANALAPITDMLAADGYQLDIESTADAGLLLRISATAESCEECLVPRSVLEPMVVNKLGERGIESSVVVEYPAAHHQS